MEISDILKHVDHTLLKPEATEQQIRTLCCEALEHNTASVCVNARYVPLAVSVLGDRIPVCAVIGFPLGAMSAEAKVFEAKDAVTKGAHEIDMVISIGDLKDKKYDDILNEISSVKKAIGDKILKVIIETCLLTDDEKRRMCHIVADAGADYIKTSTGFSSGGATADDIKLFCEEIGGKIKIKAAGGIKTREDMELFLMLGADRLGSSSAIKILTSKD